MILIITICVLLAIFTSSIHFEVMTRAIALRDLFGLSRRVEVLMLLLAALTGHVVGVLSYAIIYKWLHHIPGFGTLEGSLSGSFVDFLYFSLTCYTTLGFGDIYAVGDMRLISGLEGLNGLVLIAWSASFTFLSVQRGED
jgi:polyferredoxin